MATASVSTAGTMCLSTTSLLQFPNEGHPSFHIRVCKLRKYDRQFRLCHRCVLQCRAKSFPSLKVVSPLFLLLASLPSTDKKLSLKIRHLPSCLRSSVEPNCHPKKSLECNKSKDSGLQGPDCNVEEQRCSFGVCEPSSALAHHVSFVQTPEAFQGPEDTSLDFLSFPSCPSLSVWILSFDLLDLVL